MTQPAGIIARVGSVRFSAGSGYQAFRREAIVTSGIVGGGLVIGYLSVNDHLRTAIALTVVPLLLWVLSRFRLSILLLGISLPFAASLAGAHAAVNVAASDVLLSLIFAAVLADDFMGGRSRALGAALKPVMLPMAMYLAWMVVLLAAHPGVVSAAQSGQRLELFLIPVVIGAAIALRGLEMYLLKAYLITVTIFAALYPFFSDEAGGLGTQKNPAGGFIAAALLLLIAVRSLRGKLLLAAPVLTFGLLWTQSRGAILSVVVGLALLLIGHPGRDRLRFVVLMIPVAAVAIGAFALLPKAAQERNTSYEVGTDSRAAYSLEIRKTFREEAWQIIHAEPVFGTGIGRYVYGVDGIHPTTTDPHQVLLLQAAEGGYPLAGAFVVLVLGTAGVIAAQGRRTTLGPAAIALLLGAVGHGLVDVYWVRGTPVLGWLVVGMTMGQVAKMKDGAQNDPKPSRRDVPLVSS